MDEIARPRLIPSLPLFGGGVAGLIVAAIAVALPATILDSAVEQSGIAALLPVAAPPLGATARALLALCGGMGVAGIAWAALYLLIGPGAPFARAPRAAPDVPVVRRADAHPDAPPRRPLSAAALPELALPRDLDTPLAAFDPDALPPVPLAPVRALKPLAPPLAPGERLETFTLAPPPPVAPVARRDEPPSIETLLRRLEQGARRRTAAAH